MNINFAFVNDEISDAIKNILLKKDFTFLKYNELMHSKQKKLLIFKKNFPESEIVKEIEYIKKNNTSNIYIMLAKENKISVEKNIHYIFFPISIEKLKSTILDDINLAGFSFKNLELRRDNFLKNKNNNKKIYLTETEFQIIEMLFNNKTVNKEKIKKEILNLQVELNTKSLESHLSRLRKKLYEINSDIVINSTSQKTLEII